MEDLRRTIKRYLIRLTIDPTHVGFRQLLECVYVKVTLKLNIMNKIYAVVAKDYGIKPKSVMRDVDYALRQVPDLAERLSEIMGFYIDKSSLHNGRVVFYLADIVSEPSLFDFSA